MFVLVRTSTELRARWHAPVLFPRPPEKSSKASVPARFNVSIVLLALLVSPARIAFVCSTLLPASSSTVARNESWRIEELPLLVQDTITLNLAHSESVTESAKWQASKRTGEAKVLWNPVVHKAYVVASTVHQGHARHDGSEVMQHLEDTAIVVAMLGMGATAVAAALLHECLGGWGLDEAALCKFTSNEICALVGGVTKASRVTNMYGLEAGLHDEVRRWPVFLKGAPHCSCCVSSACGMPAGHCVVCYTIMR
jgi:HD domain